MLFAQAEVAASLNFPNKSQTSDALVAAVYSNKLRRDKPQTSKALAAEQDL
jgi:hypothetical protein